MPIPIRAPIMPPAVPPMAAPLRAAMIGPAAMNGPRPGMASDPIPTSQPRTPPSTPPVPAPVRPPSGALVPFSWAKSRVPVLSGNSTEISVFMKPASFRSSTICIACASSRARQKTDFLAIIIHSPWFLLVCFQFQLIVQPTNPMHCLGEAFERLLLLRIFHGPAQGHFSILGDDFDILGVRRKLVV